MESYIKQENIEELGNILGGMDLLKGKGPGGEAIKKAVAKIKKEQVEANEEQAEKLVRSALTIHKEAKDLERQFNGNMKKINEKFGKAIKAIKNLDGNKKEEPNAGPD